jgi:hypothetical protein
LVVLPDGQKPTAERDRIFSDFRGDRLAVLKEAMERRSWGRVPPKSRNAAS